MGGKANTFACKKNVISVLLHDTNSECFAMCFYIQILSYKETLLNIRYSTMLLNTLKYSSLDFIIDL